MSLILELHHCRIHEHWNDIGSKRRHFGAFSGFLAKGQKKVNTMTKSQLMVNPDFGAPTSQQEVPEVSHKRIPEVWSKVNFGQLRGSWSKSKSSQPCDSSPKKSKINKEHFKYHEVTHRLFLFFCSHKDFTPLPFIKLPSH